MASLFATISFVLLLFYLFPSLDYNRYYYYHYGPQITNNFIPVTNIITEVDTYHLLVPWYLSVSFCFFWYINGSNIL